MSINSLISFFLWFAILIIFSYLISNLLSKSLKYNNYRKFIALGIIVHELGHYFACKITGTEVYEVSLFDRDGGHVTHESRGPLITASISMAPIFFGALFILLTAYIFSYFGMRIPYMGNIVKSEEIVSSLISIFQSGLNLIYMNIIPLGLNTLFLMIFIYITWSVASAMAPSGTDLKHGAQGLAIFFIISLFTILIKPLSVIPGISGTPVIDFIFYYLFYAIGVGLVIVFLSLIITVPIYLIVRLRRC